MNSFNINPFNLKSLKTRINESFSIKKNQQIKSLSSFNLKGNFNLSFIDKDQIDEIDIKNLKAAVTRKKY